MTNKQTIDGIMGAVLTSQDSAFRRGDGLDGYEESVAADQHVRDMIAAALSEKDVEIEKASAARDMWAAEHERQIDVTRELRDEIEKLTSSLADAWREGAEAMREAAAVDIEISDQDTTRSGYAYSVRALPLPTSERRAVRLTDERLDALADEIFDLIQDAPDDDVGDRTWDRMFGRAIQAAVLAANGIEVRRG